jgi:hypothetical protein
MSKLKQLEIKKLMKELDFVESDFTYKNEIVHEADSNFIKSVNDLLEQHPLLKDVFDKKINNKIDNIFQRRTEELKDKIETINESYQEDSIEEEVIVEKIVYKTEEIPIVETAKEIESIEYVQNSEQSNNSIWKKIQSSRGLKPMDVLYKEFSEHGFKDINLTIQDLNDPEIQILIKYINDVRDGKIHFNDIPDEHREKLANLITQNN